MDIEFTKEGWKKTSSIMLQIAAFSTAALAIVNVYSFYYNNVYHPLVTIKDVDFSNGVANLLIDGKEFTLRGDSTYLIGYDWGIRFGITHDQSGYFYDRIELLKRNMVEQVIG